MSEKLEEPKQPVFCKNLQELMESSKSRLTSSDHELSSKIERKLEIENGELVR